MVHKDKIIRDLEFVYEGVFDFKELLSVIKSFFKRYKYLVIENSYVVSTKNNLKNTKMKWTANSLLDDYNHAFIKMKINLSNYKEAYIDSVKVVDGNFKIEIEAEINRDYREQWKKSPTKKFVRAIYEKYVSSEKQNKVDDSVKNTVDDLITEIKQYFGS